MQLPSQSPVPAFPLPSPLTRQHTAQVTLSGRRIGSRHPLAGSAADRASTTLKFRPGAATGSTGAHRASLAEDQAAVAGGRRSASAVVQPRKEGSRDCGEGPDDAEALHSLGCPLGQLPLLRNRFVRMK